MNTDELKNTLSGVKSISISVDDFIYFTKLKEETYKKVSFDEAIQAEPFVIDQYDARIIAYRKHLLTALGFEQNAKDWIRVRDNDIITDVVYELLITEASDNDFMDRIQQLTTIDFKGEEG